MIFKKSFFKVFFGVVLISMIVGKTFIAFAQFDFDTPYEVSAEVVVLKNNFVKARKKAVKIALRSSLEQNFTRNFG